MESEKLLETSIELYENAKLHYIKLLQTYTTESNRASENRRCAVLENDKLTYDVSNILCDIAIMKINNTLIAIKQFDEEIKKLENERQAKK